jgi:uncharacterized protein (TIGR00730 family)
VSTICVFCGSNTGVSPAYAEAARSLGDAIATGGHDLVYGGGRVGLMGIVADAVLSAGGNVTGVMPGHLVEREVGHTGLTRLEVTPSMHARKARMAELADGVIALPGGFGTFEEVIEVLTWNQLGLVALPVVFLDVDGFYDALFTLFDHAVASGFVREAHRDLALRTADPTDAVTLAVTPRRGAPAVDKWLDLEAT